MLHHLRVLNQKQALNSIKQVVKQPRLVWLERFLLGFEEVLLRLAALAALAGVAIVSVTRNRHLVVGLAQLAGQRVRVETGALVVNEVLQVVGIAALLGLAEQDHRLRNEDPAREH